jgi:long-chain acyl-CoA synthetase
MAEESKGNDASRITESLDEAAQYGMVVAYVAARHPDRLAIASPFGDRTFAQLNARINQLARLLRANGLGAGDAIAVVLKNRPAFVESYLAARRTGLRFTPVNFHLTADEAGYVIDDCEAKAVIYDGSLPASGAALERATAVTLKLMVDGSAPGFVDYDAALAPYESHDIADPVLGTQMLYTSGTTGKPKGVYRRTPPPVQRTALQTAAAWNLQTDMCLCTGPAYHAAPLAFNIFEPLNAGVGVVLMDKWDAEETLRLVERHRVTHTHMVATMFHRLLQLPEGTRNRYDVSSLRFVIHGAAPTPVHEKRAMIEWLGPKIFEYYAATEGGNFFVTPEEWLRKPGTVGRLPTPDAARILDDDGNEVAQGQTGTIYFKAPDVGRFEYFKAPEKTAQSYRGDWFTLGDMGCFDADSYLFLNGRNAETIISGGVNIYPQEIDSELLKHPAVLDVCTVGVPNEEWGEEVRSVVQLHEGHTGDAALAADLIAFARTRLPGFKTPRSIEFVGELPRLPSGKIQRRLVRARFWAGRDRQI